MNSLEKRQRGERERVVSARTRDVFYKGVDGCVSGGSATRVTSAKSIIHAPKSRLK
jgi:hypothetical protein